MPTTFEHFENLVQRILLLNHFSITASTGRSDRGFDFLGTLGTDTWAIEVKFYRTQRAQASLIKTAALLLNHRGVTAQATKGMLVVSCYLPIQLRFELEKDFNITFIDGADLANWAARDPALLSELQSLLEISPDDLIQVTASSQPPELSNKRLIKASLPENTEGSDLCKELRNLGRGKKHWPAYESLCERILRYLFPNDLHGWHRQKRTDDGLNRYDFVCRIRTTTDFWQFITQHLDSRYVVFEFKNYSGKIKQGQILTTEKYLLEKALRRVAIIFSRDGADKHAITMTQGAMREHGKLRHRYLNVSAT